MNKHTFRVYLVVVTFGAIITIFAVTGTIFTFRAADEARSLGRVTKCHDLVIADYIHEFHVSMAKVESLENNKVERAKVLKTIEQETSIRRAMDKCH